MPANGVIVCVFMLWSLLDPAVVSGQCTTIGCGSGYSSRDKRNLDGCDADDSDTSSELQELKLQTQMVTEELGKLWTCCGHHQLWNTETCACPCINSLQDYEYRPHILSNYYFACYFVRHGGVVVRASDMQLRGRRFESRPLRFT